MFIEIYVLCITCTFFHVLMLVHIHTCIGILYKKYNICILYVAKYYFTVVHVVHMYVVCQTKLSSYHRNINVLRAT